MESAPNPMESGVLRFADDFGQRKYALLELDEKLLETILAGGCAARCAARVQGLARVPKLAPDAAWQLTT